MRPKPDEWSTELGDLRRQEEAQRKEAKRLGREYNELGKEVFNKHVKPICRLFAKQAKWKLEDFGRYGLCIWKPVGFLSLPREGPGYIYVTVRSELSSPDVLVSLYHPLNGDLVEQDAVHLDAFSDQWLRASLKRMLAKVVGRRNI